MNKTTILAGRPDLMLKLEKYGVLPPLKKGGRYEGCAKRWAKEAKPPYDDPVYQAMAERLPVGWEELTDKEMNQLLKDLQNAIEVKRKANFDIPNIGEVSLLKKMAKMAVLGITTVACLIEDSGLGKLPDCDEGKKKETKQFSLEIALHLLMKSNFLSDFFREMTHTLSSDDKSQKLIADVLTDLVILLAIIAASNGNRDRLKDLVLSFKPSIEKGMERLEQFLSETLVVGKLKGNEAETLALYVQQARMALEKEDFNIFYEKYVEVLALLGLTPDILMKDIKSVRLLAKKMQTAFTTGMEDDTNKITAMSQAM